MKPLSPRIPWNEKTKTLMEQKLNSPAIIKEVEEIQTKVESGEDNIEEVVTKLVRGVRLVE